jgi:hypothetical protein
VKYTESSFFPAALAITAVIALNSSSASAVPIIYGSFGNFDVINDTGQSTNGFEIELEGIKLGEVVYTFGDDGAVPNPTLYIFYGKPEILANGTGTGTIVHYASRYDSVNNKFIIH